MALDAALYSLVPLFVIFGVFLIGLPIFALRTAKHGLPAEERVEKRRSLIGPFLSYFLLWMISPVERRLVAARVSPNGLTAFSLLLSVAAAAALGRGWFGLGGWLYLFNGIVDLFDGRVARATGRVTVAGAFADSVADRVAEALVFGGLAWYFRDGWVLLLVVAALAGSFLVSYTRARGEGLGVTGVDIGAMQRPERTLFLGVGIAASPIVAWLWPSIFFAPWLAVAAIGLIAVSSLFTASLRFAHVTRALAGGAPIPLPAPRRRAPRSDEAPDEPASAAVEPEPAPR